MEENQIRWAEKVSRALGARNRCIVKGNNEWTEKWQETIDRCLKLLPTGSGFDTGLWDLSEKSTPEKLILRSSYHAMLDNGMYDRWIDFMIVLTPSFETEVKMSLQGNFGKKHQDLKEYFFDILQQVFKGEVNEYDDYDKEA